jgi:hypothetical protein
VGEACVVSATDTALVDDDGVVYEAQPVLQLNRDLE